MTNPASALAPDYYAGFRCIGPDCEDTCCGGWTVTIDGGTYQEYKGHTHPELAPLFQSAVRENPACTDPRSQEYGILALTPQNLCAFLGEDGWCRIHKILGEQALSNICSVFPRQVNCFGDRVEYSLALSCPEAARRILLHPQPIEFVLLDQSPELVRRNLITRRFPPSGDLPPEHLSVWSDLRFLSIAILQCRAIGINTRLMLLGLFLESVDQEMGKETFCDMGMLQPIMEDYLRSLRQAEAVRTELLKTTPNQLFKLRIIGGIVTGAVLQGARPRLAGCLLEALDALYGAEGLSQDDAIIARYEAAYDDYYQPFFAEREYILENYLVSEAFRRVFPIIGVSAMEAYRELVCNYAITRFILVGMAGTHRGLTEALVVKLIQSFAEKSSHDRAYMPKLLQTLKEESSESLMHMVWLLRERDE